MSGFGQFDAGYNRHEDRILLRITNVNGDEFRLWLTRRLCSSLLTDFKVRTSAYRVSMPDAGMEARAVVSNHDTVLRAQLEQQAVVAQQDFGSKFKPGETFPLGEQGLVVEKVNLQPNGKADGVHTLSFHDAKGRGISLGVTVEVFNSIFEVVERVVRQTKWDLPVSTSDVPQSTLLQ